MFCFPFLCCLISLSLSLSLTLSLSFSSLQVEASLKTLEEGKNVVMDTKVDPSILGGLKVQIGKSSFSLSIYTFISFLNNILMSPSSQPTSGDRFLDFSMSSKIDKLSKVLKDAGSN